MKWLTKIVSLYVLLMLVMHNIIPHEHHSELSEEEHLEAHQSTQNPLDFLALVFHQDHSKGHLEEYVESGDNDVDEVDTTVLLAVFHPASVVLPLSHSASAISVTTWSEQRICSGLTRRGPPTLV